MRITTILALSMATAIAGNAAAQCSRLANSPPGTKVVTTDDSVRTVPLGFGFNFNGITYTTITVCSNGYVWLGAGTSADFSATQAELATLAPRIAPLWWDLNPGSTAVLPGGGVFYHSDGVGQANVVWKDVPQFATTTIFARFELILESSGNIHFVFDTANPVPVAANVVGISRGGAGNPVNNQDFSANYTTPAAITSATGTEAFAANLNDLMNLAGPGLGTQLSFFPTDSPVNSAFSNLGTPAGPVCAPGPYAPLATASTAVGTGCPTAVPNGSMYELFTATTGTNPADVASTSLLYLRSGDTYVQVPGPGFDSSYTTAGTIQAGAADDVLFTHPLAMGTFPMGTTTWTSVVVSTNGYIGGPGMTQTLNALATTFHTGPARIAGYWKDLLPNTTTAPMYVENTAGFFRMTWENVPLFTGAGTQTFQIRLDPTGDITLSYGALTGSVTTSPPLVGISGGTATNLGNDNLVTAAVANVVGPRQITGGYSPMTHTTSLAQLGMPFTMTTTVPGGVNNYGFGIWLIGGSNPAVPLDLLLGPGMAPGCSIYSDFTIELDLFYGFTAGATSFAKTIPVPYTISIAGITIFTQAGAYSPLNAGGIISSNGRTQVTGI